MAVDLSGYDALIDKIAKQLHEGKLKPSQLNQELISKTYGDLSKGAQNGYGKEWLKFPADGKGSTPLELKKNLYAFSGAKSFAQLDAINKLLIDQDGKIRPYNEFSQLARGINRQYNQNYLQAEYQTSLASAQMAEKWERLQETKDLFPNLKFRTVGDDRVRREHERLNGIVKPIDADFWNKYYPPLDFRCRCNVVATAEKPTKDDEDKLPPVQFDGNVGKDKEIFRKNGTFFKLSATDEDATRSIELSKLNAPNEMAYKGKGGKVQVNIYADHKDLTENIASAKAIVDHIKVDVQIRPHIDSWIVKGHKNPEYLIDGKIGERKAPESHNYKKSLEKANKQGCEIVIFDLSNNKDTVENALKEVNKVLQYAWVHSNIKEVYIISADGKQVEHYKREKAD